MIKDKNFIWNTIGTTLNSFLSLFLLIIITRINGIELSGMFSFIFTLTLMLQSISNYGGRIYQISDLNDEFSFQEYLSSRIKTSIISIVIFFFLFIILRLGIKTIGIAMCLIVLRIIETFSDVFYASFQKNNHLDYVGISLTIKSLLIIILFLILNILTKNLSIASFGIVIAAIMVFVFYDLLKVKKYEKMFIIFNNDIYKESKYIFLFSFVTFLLLNVPRFIANYTLNSTQIGYLGILMMIPTVMALVCQFIIQPQLVNLTKAYYEKNITNFNRILFKSNLLLLVFSFICCILAITLGPLVLKILYGISFEEYRISFLILILAGALNGATTILSNALTIFRETKNQFIAYIFVLIINITFCYVASSTYKLNGLFLGLMLSMLIQTIIFYVIYKNKTFKILKQANFDIKN